MSTDHTYRLPSWRAYCRADGGRKVVWEPSLREDQSIYHFLPWPYAEMIFRNGQLRLGPVQSWKDPYEEAWCRLLFQGQDRLSGVNAYGLCWTTSHYDEPSWRMAGFGRNTPIVRIRCLVKAILEAGRNLIDTESGSLFLGKVRYVRQKVLHRLAETVLRRKHKDVSFTASGLLLQKRNAFRFEKEVRLLWLDRAPQRERFLLPIDTRAITQVMTSPFASDDEHACIRDRLRHFGANSVQSEIFSPPKYSP